MFGHNQIINVRKSGKKPMAIFFHFGYPAPIARFSYEDPESSIAFKLFPLVTVTPDEIGERFDLRFVSGCQVHVDLKEANEISAIFLDTLVEAGAKCVVAVCMSSGLIMTYFGQWEAYAP